MEKLEGVMQSKHSMFNHIKKKRIHISSFELIIFVRIKERQLINMKARLKADIQMFSSLIPEKRTYEINFWPNKKEMKEEM